MLFEIGTRMLKAGQVFLYHAIAAELETKCKINVTKKECFSFCHACFLMRNEEKSAV
jgi:G:T-mismatch repair DNA endonuclease (very short patch repair protein)